VGEVERCGKGSKAEQQQQGEQQGQAHGELAADAVRGRRQGRESVFIR
jgi:hypothetical protein